MKELTFVAFEPRGEGFMASVPMEQLDSLGEHPESLLKEASAIYKHSVQEMRLHLSEFDRLKAKRQPVPARKVWELGDTIFNLPHSLEQTSLELDDLYAHLTRDLGVKRMWLEKVIILRRYINAKDLIPDSLKWSQFYSAPRKTAKELLESQATGETVQ